MKNLFLFVATLLLASIPSRADVTVLAPPIAFTATTTSSQAIGSNFGRKYLLIQNNGATSVLVKAGLAHSASEGIVIVAGGVWEPIVVPVDAIFLKAASGTDAMSIQEGN